MKKTATTIALCFALQVSAAPLKYTATWGGSVVTWHEPSTGHRWTCTYAEFFKYCGGKHPRELGISVKGKLPPASQRTTTVAASPPPPVKRKTAPEAKPVRHRIEEPELPDESRMVSAPNDLLPDAPIDSVTILGVQPERITILPDAELEPKPIERDDRGTNDYSSFAGKIISLLTGPPVGEKPPAERTDLVALVKRFEGFRAKRYWDHGQYSIGYGTRAKAGDGTISESEAHNRLLAELAAARADVEREATRWGMTLTACQADALTSFHFNTGAVVRLMQKAAGDASTMPGYMPEWRCASGKPLPALIDRRKRESALFASE